MSQNKSHSTSFPKATLLFLGTGGSLGVPVVSCQCPVCLSPSIFNKRLRPSVLLSIGEKKILIDIGPDFREQMLKYGICSLSGALITHAHYDHIGGLDEIRIFSLMHRSPLPLLCSKETYQEIKDRFSYFFSSSEDRANAYRPPFTMDILPKEQGVVSFLGHSFRYISYIQQGMKVTGFRFGSLAYISDIFEYDKEILSVLKGVDILIVSALRHHPSPAHFTVAEAIAFSRSVGAKRTFLTHISHDLDHHEANENLPSDIRVAHDGLELSFTFEEGRDE